MHNSEGFLGLFKRTVELYPERPALAGDTVPWSYYQLNQHAAIIAAHLTGAGLAPGSVVAIHTESRALAIAAMIAVLRSGCAYLPLDPVYPAERLNYMVSNANTGIVISDNDAFRPESGALLDLRRLDFSAAVDTAAIDETLTPAVITDLSDAYIIYTSGSTGRPKGVRMNHRTLNNLIQWQNAHYAAGETYRTLQFSSLSFDVSFQEIFATFAQGGCLYLVNNQTKQDFRALLTFIDTHSIERIFLPYIALLQLLQWANRLQLYPQSLREVITAGEQLVVSDDLKKAFRALNGARLYNQYGPSESHVVTEYALGADVDAWDNIPPIGKPIAHAQIFLLDEQQQLVADGEVGELYIGGPVLANGYINNPEESAKRFVALTIAGHSQACYRTGDLASWDAEGNVLYKGRVDSQVKISGYRVELSEIEAQLLNTDLIEEAAVAVRELRGNKSLVAFIRVKASEAFSLGSLKAQLERDLPHYMMPAEFQVLAQLLKTPTGKIDRKTMLENLANAALAPVAVGQNINQQILAIIRREIHRPEAQLQDNLLDQGMDSLAANRIAAALYDELNLTVPTYALFQYRSIKLFIDYLTKHRQGDGVAGIAARTEKSVDAEVAIIGMAVRVPGANRLDEFWENLAAGRENVHYFAETTADNYVNARGIVDQPLGFDAGFFDITPMEARFIDPQQRVLLELAWHALENAGYAPNQFPGRIGIFCGTGNNSYYINNVLRNPEQLEGYGPFQAMLANEKDYCATRIAYKLNLVGPALSIHSACSTSLVAVCNAVDAIRSGQCDIAIAGGASITFPQQQPYEYQEGSIYSRDGHTRTFDKDSSGTVFSDGAGLVVLKRLDFALSDGDQVYAAIAGAAVNNDGADKGSFSAPSIEGQKHVVMAAQQNAGVNAKDVGYIEAHGTATPIGDPIEVAALTAAFGGAAAPLQTCLIGSVKSNFGHLTAAAGVVGLIKSALSVEQDFIPKTLHVDQPNPALNIERSPFVIAAQAAPWNKPYAQRIAGVSSFGIGGTNAHVVIKGVEPIAAGNNNLPSWVPLCVSAASPAALLAYLESYRDYFKEKNPEIDAASLALYLARHRAALKYRKAIAVVADKPLWSLFEKQSSNDEPVPTIDNIVFAFPGQGSQVVRMGAELYEAQESFREAFDRCHQLLVDNHQFDLKKLLLEGEGDLGETRHTQIALFSLCYSLAQSLNDLGVRATAAIGHSIGELAAAVIAGVFDLATGLRIVITRGSAMQAQPRGSIVAVREPASNLTEYLTAGLVVAAQNTPESCTIAGTTEAIAALCEKLSRANIKFKNLDTSHAFHSPAMDGAKAILAESLADVKLSPPQIPFISCVTGDWIRPEQATDIHYWADQLRQPVKFYQGIEKLAELPNLLVIECGPQRTVSGMILQTLTDKSDLHLVHLLGAAGQPELELASFSQALGNLWELGVELHWPAGDLKRAPFKHLPLYPFQRSIHVIEPSIQFGQVSASASAGDGSASSFIAPTPTAVMTMTDAIISQLENLFSDISGMDLHNADRKATFFELGLDSLLLTQSTIKLKKQFKVQVTFRQLLNDCNNFSALADYLVNNGVKVDVPAAPVAVATAAPATAQNAAAAVLATPAQTGAPQQFSAVQLPALNIADGNVVALLQQQMQLLQGQLALLTSYSGGALPQLTMPTQAQLQNPAVLSAAAAPAVERTVKPFGAGTRINVKRSNDMTDRQKANLDALSARYNTRFKSSKQFAQDNRKHLADPRVVSGFRNTLKEIIYPIVVARSEGAYLWDIDGFRFVDITCGFGSNFFGNSAPFIKEAVAKQLDIGYEIGPQHPLMAEAAKLFSEVTGNERCAFCNTGSEAVIGAMRLARTVTAKEKIVMFENDYHGINDEVIVTRGSNGFATPAAAGIPDAAVENVIMLDYGDDKSLDYIREHADEIAGLLIEPVQSRYPELQPREFLKKARALCTELNIAFIFDEVITGFRIHQRGAQGYYGIDADICTYGKIVGGGLPVGVIAGKKEFMDALDGGHWQYGDNSSPEVGVTYFAGTFVRHPLVLAAAVAVLTKLKAEPDLQLWLNARADRMVTEINNYAAMVGAPLKIANCGSMCKIKIPQEIAYEELIYVLLREKGIHVWDARPTFITTAHSDEDIEFIIKAFKEAIDEMLVMDFFPVIDGKAAPALADQAQDSDSPASHYQKQHFTPPIPGAKLGRDEEGRAVWYVPSAKDPSQFDKWQG